MAENPYKSIAVILQDFGNEIQEGIRQNLNSKNASVSGILESSVNFEVKIFKTDFKLTLVLADYYDYVNKGVNGVEGQVGSPYSFKTINPSKKHRDALTTWAMHKGIVSNPEDAKRFGYLAAKKQKREGKKGNHFFDEVVTNQRLEKLQKDLTEAASIGVESVVFKTAKKIFN